MSERLENLGKLLEEAMKRMDDPMAARIADQYGEELRRIKSKKPKE